MVSPRSYCGRGASDSYGIRRGHQTHRKCELYTHWDLTPIRAVWMARRSTEWGSEAASAGIGLRISRSGVRIPPGAPTHVLHARSRAVVASPRRRRSCRAPPNPMTSADGRATDRGMLAHMPVGEAIRNRVRERAAQLMECRAGRRRMGRANLVGIPSEIRERRAPLGYRRIVHLLRRSGRVRPPSAAAGPQAPQEAIDGPEERDAPLATTPHPMSG